VKQSVHALPLVCGSCDVALTPSSDTCQLFFTYLIVYTYIGVLHAAQGAAPCVNYAGCIAAYVHNELKVNTLPIAICLLDHAESTVKLHLLHVADIQLS
jgi:hypothetical protein